MRAMIILVALATPACAVDEPKVQSCMSLLNPEMLFCADAKGAALMCDVSGLAPTCQTLPAMYASWRKRPELRETFYRRLYGNEK
jgi:hypothetical protein